MSEVGRHRPSGWRAGRRTDRAASPARAVAGARRHRQRVAGPRRPCSRRRSAACPKTYLPCARTAPMLRRRRPHQRSVSLPSRRGRRGWSFPPRRDGRRREGDGAARRGVRRTGYTGRRVSSLPPFGALVSLAAVPYVPSVCLDELWPSVSLHDHGSISLPGEEVTKAQQSQRGRYWPTARPTS